MAKSVNFSPATKSSIKKLEAAVSTFGELFEELRQYTDKLEDNLEQQALVKEQTEEIEVQNAERQRIANLNLELAIKKDRKEAMERIARETDHVVLPEIYYEQLLAKQELVEKELNAAIGKEKGKAERAQKQAIRELEAQHKTDTANLTHRVAALEEVQSGKDSMIQQLTAQVNSLTEALKEANKKAAITQQYGKVA